LPRQLFRPRHVGRGCVGHLIENAGREHGRQPALRIDRTGIKRQCAFKQVNHLRPVVTRPGFRRYGTSPENVVQRIGMLDRVGGLRADELQVECGGDPACDLVL
jgi:hypothetical protein